MVEVWREGPYQVLLSTAEVRALFEDWSQRSYVPEEATTLIPLNVPRICQNTVEMLEDRIGIATRQADDQKQAERKRLHEERRKKLAAMNAKVPDHRRTKGRTRASDNDGPRIN